MLLPDKNPTNALHLQCAEVVFTAFIDAVKSFISGEQTRQTPDVFEVGKSLVGDSGLVVLTRRN